MKVTWGPDGTGNDTDVATGKPLPVQLRGSDGTDRSNLLPVTANAGTNLNTSALALETGGNLATTAATLGATTGSAVITDANGTIQQYLRGLIKQWIAGTLALGIGQNTIGNVGGKTATVTNTLSIAGSTYGTNYSVGGIQTFANAFTSTGSGVLQAVSVTTAAAESNVLSFVVFNANPANAIADNGAAAINSADVGKVVAVIPLTPSSVLGAHTVWYAYGIGLALNVGATSLYGIVVSNSAFGATINGLTTKVAVSILQDA